MSEFEPFSVRNLNHCAKTSDVHSCTLFCSQTMSFCLLAFLFLSESLAIMILQPPKEARTGDKRTLMVIWFSYSMGAPLGVIMTMFCPILKFNLPLWACATAVFSCFLFVALRWWAMATLGRFFTVRVSTFEDHEVVRTGPYKILRHPSYTGGLGGYALALITFGNLIVVLCGLLLTVPATLYRIHVEEKALTQALGDEYIEYMKTSYRLIPWVY